jgi:guanine deaminase
VSDEAYMRQAIEKARQGLESGQSPFGACIVRDGKVIACAHNVVLASTDITAHAEMHAIREACRALQTIDLSGSVIYSTCEPCAMCFGACHWARIGRIVYGVRSVDSAEFGFHELPISDETLKELAHSSVELVPDCLAEENRELFRLWAARSDKRVY